MKQIKSEHADRKYYCDQCDFKSAHKSSLFNHVKSKHNGVKYPCDQCDYQATEKGRLNIHKKSIHSKPNTKG